MVRKKRIWDPDSFCHIVSRGNRRDSLFYETRDFKTFIHILQQVNKNTPFELASYCLMTNHYHLLMRSKEQPISNVMSLVNKRYADYYNTKNKLTGHVFEKRFYDKIIASPIAILELSRYIHLNPVEAGLVSIPEAYRWSSYRYFMNTTTGPLLSMDVILDYFPGNKAEKRQKYNEFIMAEKRGVADYLIDASK